MDWSQRLGNRRNTPVYTRLNSTSTAMQRALPSNRYPQRSLWRHLRRYRTISPARTTSGPTRSTRSTPTPASARRTTVVVELLDLTSRWTRSFAIVDPPHISGLIRLFITAALLLADRGPASKGVPAGAVIVLGTESIIRGRVVDFLELLVVGFLVGGSGVFFRAYRWGWTPRPTRTRGRTRSRCSCCPLLCCCRRCYRLVLLML